MSIPIHVNFKKMHIVQAAVQLSVLAYWCLFSVGIREFLPYIAAQLVYAFAVSMAIEYYKTREVRVDFSVLPIVFSLNFFIHFRIEFFVYQLLVVGLAILIKSFVRYKSGEPKHIFNPSAIAILATGLLLMATGRVDWVYGSEFIQSFMLAPHFHFVIFALGCVSLWFAQRFLVSVGALVGLCGSFFLGQWLFGLPPTPYMVHENVFLGLTLLATDPVTSPKKPGGQFFFGLAYGLSIVVAYELLTYLQQPRYYDKILFLPALNLVSRYFDKFSWEFPRWLEPKKSQFVLHLILTLSLLPAIERSFGHRSLADQFDDPKKGKTMISDDLKNRLATVWRKKCEKDASLAVCSRETGIFDFANW